VTAQAPQRQLLRLLQLPLDAYRNVLTALKLEHYAPLVALLPPEGRRRVALEIVRCAIDNSTLVPTVEQAQRLFEWIAPLLRDEETAAEGAKGGAGAAVDEEEFAEEQQAVARLVHLLDSGQAADAETTFQLLNLARKQFGAGGARRLRFTLPPLVHRSLALAARLKQASRGEEWATGGRRIFKFAHDTATALARTQEGQPEQSFALFLACANGADRAGFDTIAYEFLTQAFVVYEQEISDSRAQFAALSLLIGTLQQMQSLQDEVYEAVATKCAVHATKLLKKPDQARAVYRCAHLFWCEPGQHGTREYRDGKRVLECLQKALKIADQCMDAAMNVHLFVEILDRYVYFYEHRNEAVLAKYLTGLIQLINTNLASLEQPNSPESLQLKLHFQNILRHMRRRKEAGDPLYEQFEL
jgi:vacuolar protein sorting-associated protein 35